MFQNNFYEKYLSQKITRLQDYNCVGVTFSGQFIMSLRKVFSFIFFSLTIISQKLESSYSCLSNPRKFYRFKFRQTPKLKQKEIFYQNYKIALFLLNLLYVYSLYNIFCGWVFKNEVINIYMHTIMQNFKINAQVCIYSLADLNIGHCVELTFFEGKLNGFLVIIRV